MEDALALLDWNGETASALFLDTIVEVELVPMVVAPKAVPDILTKPLAFQLPVLPKNASLVPLEYSVRISAPVHALMTVPVLLVRDGWVPLGQSIIYCAVAVPMLEPTLDLLFTPKLM